MEDKRLDDIEVYEEVVTSEEGNAVYERCSFAGPDCLSDCSNGGQRWTGWS